MGITIHYKGKIKDTAIIPKLQKEMVSICEVMEWDYQLWNEDFAKPYSASLQHGENGANIKGHIPIRGITIVVEPENESVNLLFNPQGELTSFMLEIMQHDGTLTKDQMWVSVKTQFGTVDAHIAIAKLLKYVRKKYIPNLIVKDEGEYWETESREHLVKKRAFLFGKLALVEKALKSIELDGNETSDQLVEKIERALKNLK